VTAHARDRHFQRFAQNTFWKLKLHSSYLRRLS
jgi:hypothetical protein